MTGRRARGLRAGALVATLLPLVALAPARAFVVTDGTGRTVTLPAAPRRIVSLVPGVTEMLFAIGAEERVVGRTDFCDYPPAARAKPSVGGTVSPSLEMLVSLKPDLVIATSAGNSEETRQQLERLKLPLYLVDPHGLSDVFRAVERLGDMADRRQRATELVAGLERRVRAVAARVASRPRPRVLYVVWPEPLIVPGRGAAVTELIALAGGDSVSAEAGEGYPRYSVEAAVAHAPEVIVLARHGAHIAPYARDTWERFAGLPAVRAGRLHSVDGDLFHRFGPRAVDALEILARLLHPEAFSGAAAR
ncbi:MAG TPA: cobalamin-binding protein [Methylomirabilota bacterium]|nr:cobalamin-binding protein [Methylomirabilota bacterium]